MAEGSDRKEEKNVAAGRGLGLIFKKKTANALREHASAECEAKSERSLVDVRKSERLSVKISAHLSFAAVAASPSLCESHAPRA